VRRLASALAVALAAGLLLTGCNLPYGPTTYTFSSASMLPTIGEGDLILAPSKPCRGIAPQRGDIVAFHAPVYAGGPPSSSKPVMRLQRVVAGPGDRLAIKAGRLVLNGAPVRAHQNGFYRLESGTAVDIVYETLAPARRYATLGGQAIGPMSNQAEITIPAGHWFILGDNRDNALDSRVFGPVPQANICGVASKIIHSKDPARSGQDL
jgi:signal peptidase I